MNKQSNDSILNDLKTLQKLKDIRLEEDVTSIDDTSSSNVKNAFTFSNLFRKLYNQLFPPRCYMCGKVHDKYEESLVCDDCKSIYKQYRVDKKFFDGDGKEIGIGIYRYDGVVRFLIQKLKYEKNKKIAYALSELAFEDVKNFLLKHHVNYIVPMPIHKDRLKERGFNQSELIAKRLSEKLNIPYRTDVIGRSRYTIPQSKLKNEERRDNVKNSFEILNEIEVMGKDIFLVDDIYTTGSTIEECSKVLYEHNTRKVYFLSISVSNNKLKGECNDEN
ncbi:MAG: ComF family protein [Clostridia bacterium]|nr:ComF family protein [Clostridia bacterium]